MVQLMLKSLRKLGADKKVVFPNCTLLYFIYMWIFISDCRSRVERWLEYLRGLHIHLWNLETTTGRQCGY